MTFIISEIITVQHMSTKDFLFRFPILYYNKKRFFPVLHDASESF